MKPDKILFFEDEQLYKEREYNGMNQWMQTIGADSFDTLSHAKKVATKLSECLLITSTQEGLDVAKKQKIPVLAYETSIRLHSDYIILKLFEADVIYLQHVFERQKKIPWTVIETKRCYLREMALEDLDALYEIYAPPEMTRYMEPLYEPREKEEEYTKAYIENIYPFMEYGMWVVIWKESGKVIGRAGVDNHEFYGKAEPELGYIIAKEYQNQKIATEVCEAILTYMSEETQLERMNCLIERENTVSISLVKHLGFTFLEEYDCNGKIMDRYTKRLLFS